MQDRIHQIADAVPTIFFSVGGNPPSYVRLSLGKTVLKLSLPDRTVERTGLVQMVTGSTFSSSGSECRRVQKELNRSATGTDAGAKCKYLALISLIQYLLNIGIPLDQARNWIVRYGFGAAFMKMEAFAEARLFAEAR